MALFFAAVTSLAWRQRSPLQWLASGLRPTTPRIAPPVSLRQVHHIASDHALANARASHTTSPAIGLCSRVFGSLKLPGAGEGCCRRIHTEHTATSTSIQASASPRPSRFGRAVDRYCPPFASFRGCGSSWTAERLYFGHSLIAVYIMNDITQGSRRVTVAQAGRLQP